MKKPLFYKADAQRDPSRNNIAHKFLTGEEVTEAQLGDAGIELKAFFHFTGFVYDHVLNGMFAEAPIPVTVILRLCPPVTSEALEKAAEREAAKDLPPRILREELTGLERWQIQQGDAIEEHKKIERERYRKSVLLVLNYLAEHKTEWTLLGIKSSDSLNNIVTRCLGLAVLKRMQKSGCLSTKEVNLLLARHMAFGPKRTKKPNKRTSVQRAETAKKTNKTGPTKE